MSPYPYGMCEADADLYGEDAEPDDMAHRECSAMARHRDDQLVAFVAHRNAEREYGAEGFLRRWGPGGIERG